MLFNENSLIETMLDVMPFCVYVVDVETYQIIYMNKAMKATREDFTGQTCYKALYEEDSPCFFCQMGQLLDENKHSNGSTNTFEHFNEFEDKWYQMQEKAITWPNGRIVKYSIAVDITELKEMQNNLAEAHAELALKNKELENLSKTDALTKISNRMLLNMTLEEQIEGAKRYNKDFSVILLDIDDFKKLNDTFGHVVGDEMLVSVSESLCKNIRATDTIGRWGGEEFMVILPEQNIDQAMLVAEKLRESVLAVEHENAGGVTASFGVTQYVDGDCLADITERVDKAMYSAKGDGKNRSVKLEG